MRQQVVSHVCFIRVDVHLHQLKHARIIADVIRANSFSRQPLAFLGGGCEADATDRKPLCILDKNFLEALKGGI